jgi:A/G-specific adenine glycosylase
MPSGGGEHLNPALKAEMQKSLLRWAGDNLRRLPWRATPRNPYHVWVSEIMLQQTRVDTVTPYFTRWLERFPDVQTLAAAPMDDVLKSWEGLGYYARARNLHAAAKAIVSDHGGNVPDSRSALQHLPGVGRYTAGAILSIAFGQNEPVLDGNVRRVLSRMFAVDKPNRARLDSLLWQIAEALLPRGKAGMFNEALMELGATVCSPRAPMCAECPWAFACAARKEGRQEAYPARVRRPAIPHYNVTAAVIWKNPSEFLVAQRAAIGLLGGLWEFPGGKVEPGESLQDCLRREILEELGVRIVVGDSLTVVKHAYTHFRITLHAFYARIADGEPDPSAIGCADWRWIRLAEVQALAFSAADLRILDALHGLSSPFGGSA